MGGRCNEPGLRHQGAPSPRALTVLSLLALTSKRLSADHASCGMQARARVGQLGRSDTRGARTPPRGALRTWYTAPTCPRRVATNSPSAPLQSFIVLSNEALASQRPSGEKATWLMSWVCPVRRASGCRARSRSPSAVEHVAQSALSSSHQGGLCGLPQHQREVIAASRQPAGVRGRARRMRAPRPPPPPFPCVPAHRSGRPACAASNRCCAAALASAARIWGGRGHPTGLQTRAAKNRRMHRRPRRAPGLDGEQPVWSNAPVRNANPVLKLMVFTQWPCPWRLRPGGRRLGAQSRVHTVSEPLASAPPPSPPPTHAPAQQPAVSCRPDINPAVPPCRHERHARGLPQRVPHAPTRQPTAPAL